MKSLLSALLSGPSVLLFIASVAAMFFFGDMIIVFVVQPILLPLEVFAASNEAFELYPSIKAIIVTWVWWFLLVVGFLLFVVTILGIALVAESHANAPNGD